MPPCNAGGGLDLKEYLKQVMKEEELSAQEIARRSEGQITGAYVTRILRGETKRPSVEKLKGLAKGIGRPLEDVLHVAGGIPSDAQVNEELLSKVSHHEDLLDIAKTLLVLEPEQVKRIRAYLMKNYSHGA